VRSASLGSKSLPALKAFLQGEQFLRRSEWDSALAYHQRALAQDSGFALAWSHAGMAAGWQHRADDSLSRAYKLRAGALNHGLAPRESLVVASESLAAVVYAGPALIGGRWWTYGRRLIATLDEAVRRYPDDPELWYMAGDARFHAGGLAAMSSRTALDAFDRSIALDSAFTPSYVHAVPLGLELNGTESGRRYARAFLAAGGMGRYAQSTELVLQLLDPATRNGAVRYLADSADAHLFQTVWLALNHWTDSAETVVALIRARTSAEQAAGRPSNFSTFSLPVALAARGHIRDAYARTTFPGLLAQFAVVGGGGVPADSLLRLARALAARPNEAIIYAAPLLAAQHDTASLIGLARMMDATRQRPLPPNVPPIARDFFGYLAPASRAFLALARGDSATALRLFDALPDTACFGGCLIDDLVHVQLLVARGRLGDAKAHLERPPVGFSPGLLPIEVLRALERGRVYERLGDRERAVAGYTLVAEAWRNADPELKVYVEEARAALARLTGEKRSS
jgi:eukaryotic-like serine/threonine-protein kinase